MHLSIPSNVSICYIVLGVILIQISEEASTDISLYHELCPMKCKCRTQGKYIRSVDCSNGHLESVPPDLPPNIQFLNLANNLISLIKRDCLIHLSTLQHFSLRGNELKIIESDLFVHLWRLQSLDLSNNFLKTLQPHVFRNLTSLKKLSLRNNSLLYLPGIFPDSVFGDLYNLIELDLKNDYPSDANSSLCYPDVALSKLRSLEKLHINGMLSSCLLGYGFRNMKKLRLLDFGNAIDLVCRTDALPELFFSNLTTSTDLAIDFFNCDIKSIHQLAFSHVPSLTSLVLAYNNHLSFDNFNVGAASLPSKRLKKIDISYIKGKYHMNFTFHCIKNLQHTALETLIMQRNGIINIDKDVPTRLPKTLKFWDISDNNLQRVDFLYTLTWLIQLEVLFLDTQNKNRLTENMRYTKINTFPNVTGKVFRSIEENFPIINFVANSKPPLRMKNKMNWPNNNILSFPQKRYRSRSNHREKLTLGKWIQITSQLCKNFSMNISKSLYSREILFSKPPWFEGIWNFIDFKSQDEINIQGSIQSDIGQFPLPRNLRELHASELKLGYSIPPLNLTGNTVIEYLNFSRNFLWCFEGPLFGLSSVKEMDLSENFAIAINPLFFSHMDSLTRLSLHHNSFGNSLEVDTSGETFSTLKYLEYLDVSVSDIHELSPVTFTYNTRLRYLTLRKNALYKFAPTLALLRHLEYLDLSFNDLPGLSTVNMQELDELSLSNHKRGITVNILHNPLLCDCSNLQFLKWYMKTKVRFAHREKYRCQYINGSKIQMQQLHEPLRNLWRVCNGQLFLLISVILLSVTTLIETILALISYHKYKLYYYLYINKHYIFHQHLADDRHGMQDVFLVFDDQDTIWRRHVLDVFLPNLTRAEVTIHVSEVGVDEPTAGRPIWEVVHESVLAGRKTVVLLTRDIFLDSENQLSVNMAKVIQDMTGSQRLIFLCAEKLIASTLPIHLYHLLRSSHIIRYAPGCNRFWVNLVKKIKDK